MTTETTFPVTPGDLITVKCLDGFINQGSETITCQNGIHYEFDIEPECKAQGESFVQCALSIFKSCKTPLSDESPHR